MNRQEVIQRKRNAIELHKQHKRNAKRTIERLKREIAELESAPRLPAPSGTMIQFSKRFLRNGPTYQYVAVEVNGRWYLSGAASPQCITWARLADFIEKDNFEPVRYTPLIKAIPVNPV